MHFDNNGYVLEGGLDPLLLTEKYGCPLYIYETAIMKNQYDRLTKAFALPNLKINYACKALQICVLLNPFEL